MKRQIVLVSLCFVAAALGANFQPLLTGAGKLLFPEASPGAYLSASSGALTVAAGGTNKNVTLTPSGTGSVNTAGSIFATGQQNPLPTLAGVRLAYNSGTAIGDVAAYDWAGSTWKSLNLRGGPLLLNYSGGGNVCVNQASCSYQFDVAGDINTSTGYRVAGTAGLSVTKTIRNSAGTGTCTLIYTGGILTGGTC